ncbi:hypothetical protein BgiMline_017578 [Biomphalaria glabrata]
MCLMVLRETAKQMTCGHRKINAGIAMVTRTKAVSYSLSIVLYVGTDRRVLRALEFLLGFCYWIALAFALDIFLLDYLDPCLGVLASRLSFSRSLS